MSFLRSADPADTVYQSLSTAVDVLIERMETRPEINWSEVTQQAIQVKAEALEVMDELTRESEFSESDMQEMVDEIDESGRKRVAEESE